MIPFEADKEKNLLPRDGVVRYFGPIMSRDQANGFFDVLLSSIEWRNDVAIIYGKRFVTARKVAWYADSAYAYTYSGTTKQALPWTNELLALKEMSEHHTGASFNSCLLNLYHNGNEGMAWHSDDEKALDRESPIASLSFGAERKFSFKHKATKETLSLVLEHGSLLLMQRPTQTFWHHRLPPTKKVNTPRINLTFRTMLKTS